VILLLMLAAWATVSGVVYLLKFDRPAIGSFTTEPDPLVRESKTIGSSNSGRRKPARSKLSSFWAAKTPF